MQIKLPFIVSTSEYNSPDVKWIESDPPIAAALCRASIGTPNWMGGAKYADDDSFPIYWPQWAMMKVARCAYHFAMNELGGADQGAWFWQCVCAGGGWKHGDVLCLDVEEEGPSAKMLLDFFTQLQALKPELTTDDFLIYSRADILDNISFAGLSEAQKQYLLSISTWIAGYPDDPDPYDFKTLAEIYHADTTRWGKCVIVQYAGSAVVPGVSKPGFLSVECNAADADYLAKWTAETQGNIPPEHEVVKHIIEGDIDDLVITPSTFGILPYQDILQFAKDHNLRAAMNAGAGGYEWDVDTFEINGLSAWHGHIYSEATFDSQSFYIDQQGNVSDEKPMSIWTAVPYSRKLVLRDGSINPELDTTQRSSWNVIAFKAGKSYLIITEGQEGSSGFTQMELAEWVKLNYDFAYLCDSGHPGNMAENGQLVYSAYNERIQFGVGFVQTGGSTMITTQKGTALVDGLRIKNASTGAVIDYLAKGEIVYGNWSPTKSDLIDITNIYQSDGVTLSRALNETCKVTADTHYLSVISGTEPSVQPPTDSGAPKQVTVEMPDGSVYVATTFTKQ